MIGVDTNVLVRYMVRDDPRQTEAATALLESGNQSFGVCQIVLCELVWVLSRAYGYDLAEIAAALRMITKTAQFFVEGSDEVTRAIERYRSGAGDFSDFLILERSLAIGCDSVATLDLRLLRDPRFQSPL